MSEQVTGCKHKSCHHPLFGRTNFCIFHLPKKTVEEREKLSKQQKEAYKQLEKGFRRAFYDLLVRLHEDDKKGNFNFRYFKFVDINLNHWKLKDELKGCTGFNKPVDFFGAEFQQADFSRATFQQADFSGTKFQKADFIGAKFQEKADFSGAIFQSAMFGSAIFQQGEFSGAEFQYTSFRDVNFQQANFSIAVFHLADFMNAKFKRASFYGAQFQQIDFRAAQFQQETDSKWIGFEHDFSRAQFRKANFSGAKFKGPVNFNYSTIKGKFVFRGNKQNRIFRAETVYTGFREIILEPEARVIFEKVNLKRASFLGTNIADFEFHDVVWNPGEYIIKRKCLWEEHNYKRADLAKLEDNYHQLVLNYEDKRDFESAMQFRIGEMEMKRRLKATSKNKTLNRLQLHVLNFHAWYKYLSIYGTNYWRALLWLGVWLGLAALAFMLSGFTVAQPVASGAPAAVIAYDISFSRSAGFWEILRAFGHSLGYAFSVLSLQKSTLYQASGGWSVFLVGAARIVFYSQVTLLLLAVRRRFKQ